MTRRRVAEDLSCYPEAVVLVVALVTDHCVTGMAGCHPVKPPTALARLVAIRISSPPRRAYH